MVNPTIARALTLLEAVRLTSEGDIPALQQLLLSGILESRLVLRVLLTFLPEGTDPDDYVGLLQNLPNEPSSQTLDYSKHPKLDIPDDEACGRVRKLHLMPLASPDHPLEKTDILTRFLIHQAYRIESNTGSLTDVVQLLEPFVDHSEVLRTWMISTLLPPLRFNYTYYTQSKLPIQLDHLERAGEQGAIQELLSKAAVKNISDENIEVGRDLRSLVGPWMYGETSRKRRKTSHDREPARSLHLNPSSETLKLQEDDVDSAWSYVNVWILDLGTRDFTRAVDVFAQWEGPTDVDYGDWGEHLEPLTPNDLTKEYAQAGLAVVYATERASMETIIGSHRIILKVAHLLNLDEPPDLKRSDEPFPSGIPPQVFDSISQPQFLHNALLRPNSTLTVANEHSIALCNLVLCSVYKLLNLGNVKSIRDTMHLCLFGPEHEQMTELRKTLYTLKSEKLDDKLWSSVRKQLLWLRDWERRPGSDTAEPRGVFSKISSADLETEILRAMLDGGSYTLAAEIYCGNGGSRLSPERVESTALAAAFAFYDAASNGNRTRGGVRKASEIVSTFRGYFPNSEQFSQIAALLAATHSTSFYSLSLQHGIPFQPVNIRAYKDPMSLIGKILNQNPRSYTHLDDLQEIGQNLVAAGLSHPESDRSGSTSTEDAATNARRRITRMAIEAALAEDDFDTAYSYVVNRLTSASQTTNEGATNIYDDISWRAAYAAGRHPMNDSDGSVIRRLEQRMELLSQALLLAPPPTLSEILQTWQQFELDLTGLIAKDAAEEEAWEVRTSQVPGGFSASDLQTQQKARDPGRKAIQEEAPMGLFEVARGAASALSKNAFPLRGPQKAGALNMAGARSASIGSGEGSGSDGGDAEAAGRVRKRDMVSSMVTGGLASGIGWVIGESNLYHGRLYHSFILTLFRCPSCTT